MIKQWVDAEEHSIKIDLIKQESKRLHDLILELQESKEKKTN